MLKTHVLMFLVVYFLALSDYSLNHDHVHIEHAQLKETDDSQGLIV